MNPSLVLSHFNQISEAPNAAARLRQFIYQLAIRGKLSEPEPEDSSAAELADLIYAERMKRGSSLGNQEQRLILADGNDAPMKVPAHWIWLRMNNIGSISGGMTPSKSRPDYWDGDINWFSPKDIKSNDLFASEMKITDAGAKETGLQLYPPGCLFMVARSGILKRTFPVAINRVEATANQDLKVLNPYFSGLERYLQIVLIGMTGRILSKLVKTGTTVQSLKYDEFESQLLPMPPLAEQQRIISKIDELMVLCDRLEEARAAQETQRDRVTTASLAQLNSDGNRDSFSTHANFFVKNVSRFINRPDHTKHIRQTILNLAVRGRLVPQSPADQSASELMFEIQKHKQNTNRKRKRDEGLQSSAIDPSKAPYKLPAGWAWARFSELGVFGRGKSKHRPRNDPSLFEGGTHLLIQTGDVARSRGNIRTYTNMYNNLGLAQSLKWPKGTLCITIAANIADSGILSFDACFPDSVVGFIPAEQFPDARYFEYFIRTAKANLLEFAPATAQKNINLEILNAVLIPLPPLAEQERIVARVDDLMNACDKLEEQLRGSQTLKFRLLEAILKEALEDRPAEEDLRLVANG